MKWILMTAFVLLPLVSEAADDDRARNAAALFDKYCLSAAPTFASIDRSASEAGMSVAEDRSMPMPNGQVMRQKNWLTTSSSGAAVMLASSDVTNNGLHVTGCGVYGPDLNADALEAALSALPRMGAVKRHAEGPGGSSTTWWWASVGLHAASEDSAVMMSRNVPNIPGASVNLIYKTHL